MIRDGLRWICACISLFWWYCVGFASTIANAGKAKAEMFRIRSSANNVVSYIPKNLGLLLTWKVLVHFTVIILHNH